MDRLFFVLGLCALLALAPIAAARQAQPVFFSLFFPQLMPDAPLEATPGEAVFL